MATDGEDRKATEILLSLESKMETMIKVMSTYDMTIKILLDRVNKMHSYINSLQEEMIQEQLQKTKEEQFRPYDEPKRIFDINQDDAIPESNAPIANIRSSRTNTLPVEKQTENSEKKVPVTQRITDSNGKDLFIADVSVMTKNNELVVKAKTNTVGKWQAHLKPGDYIINVVKVDAATKKKIEAMQEITIPPTNGIFTLPTAIIKRN